MMWMTILTWCVSFAVIFPSNSATHAAPVVIAHRGASGYLPEHTREAKVMAYAMGADFLEQDLVLTKDDVPIVLHDIHLDAVTDVVRKFPERRRADGRIYALDLTLAEVKQLRVTERFDLKTGKPVYPKRFPGEKAAFELSTLEEELQLIRGLNRSTGRSVGIYPELKQPKWHRDQGRDISKVVLPILARYGYETKAALCFLQCFELAELKRLRTDLGWQGRLVLLIGGNKVGADGTDFDRVCTDEGLTEIAGFVDAIGPAISRVVTWSPAGVRQTTSLPRLARAHQLAVHAWTVRTDELPKHCPSVHELHEALLNENQVDAVFSDFPDITKAAVVRGN
ncbi:MAG: Glycerophosphoryl diester phosphodiesterase precursor [Verrucomicrobiota bacterium]|jgi:glycerophosphoryl diester phosphodiesterase